MTDKPPKTIGKAAFDSSIASARKTLKDDLPWIANSAILERVYFAGVFASLREIADEDDLKGLMLQNWADTAFNRSFDDTFASTNMGDAFNTLVGILKEREAEGIPANRHTESIAGVMQRLAHAAEAHANQIMQTRHDIHDLLDKLQDNIVRCTSLRLDDPDYRQVIGQQHHILQELEYCVRNVALLETEHNRWKGLSS
jgi:hypothetical protein